MATNDNMPLIPHVVHKFQGFPFYPSPITALAISANGEMFVVCRENGDMDIWSNDFMFPERTIAGAGENARDVMLMKGKNGEDIVVVSGLDSFIRFYSLNTNNLIVNVPSGGGSVWRMTQRNNLIAVACEDGCVRIFDGLSVDENNSDYLYQMNVLYTLRGDNKRALCCNWYHDERSGTTYMIGGSQSGKVHVWEIPKENDYIKNVNPISSMNLRTGEGKVIPWRIVCAPTYAEFMVACSDGSLLVWDMIGKTQIQSLKLHTADITSLDISENCNTIYSAGLDNYVLKSLRQDNGKWLKSKGSRIHTHDIWDISLSSNNYMISGGNDTSVIYHRLYGTKKKLFPITLSPYPHIPRFSVVTIEDNGKSCVFIQKKNSVELWSLADIDTVSESSPEISITDTDVKNPSEQLLDIHPKCGFIQTSSISPSGNFIAISDREVSKVYKIEWNGVKAKISLKTVNEEKAIFEPGEKVIITENRLIIGGTDKSIYIYNTATLKLEHTFHEHKLSFKNRVAPISLLQVSANGKWLACSDLTNRIIIYDLESFEVYTTLELFEVPISNMRFHPASDKLVILLITNEIWSFNTNSNEFDSWSFTTNEQLPKVLSSTWIKMFGIAFNPDGSDNAYIYGRRMIIRVDLEEGKRVYTKTQSNGTKNIVFADYIRENTLVIIDRPLKRILPHLPPPMKNPRYGNA